MASVSEATRVRAFIALGSNLGDPAARLDAARRALDEAHGIEVVRTSSYHRTKAVGGPADQPDYLNAVAELSTELGPEELLERLLEIEQAEGRERSQELRWGPRRLDLDLLMHGDSKLQSDALTLPHPRLEERTFVLAPLAELVPELVLAGCGLSVAGRLQELEDGAGCSGIVRLGNVKEAREWCHKTRAQGRSLGFVATMGALHEGHLTLVQRALEENDSVCVSVFVNPLQFGEASDLENYPRDFDGDARLLEEAGAAMVFTGTLAQFFEGELDEQGGLPSERLIQPGAWARGLEGTYRIGHFDGVATIVDRLFDVVVPDRAYFGQKDYQQANLIADLAQRRGGPEVVVCSTSREASGLARSSRNTRLNAEQLELATCISRGLFAAARLWQAGERDAERLTASLRGPLVQPGLLVEYAELRDPLRWSDEPPSGALERAVALVAVRIGEVRLIDNFVLSDAVPDVTPSEG